MDVGAGILCGPFTSSASRPCSDRFRFNEVSASETPHMRPESTFLALNLVRFLGVVCPFSAEASRPSFAVYYVGVQWAGMDGIPQGWMHERDADKVHLPEAVPVVIAEGSDWVEDT
ncbi:hypothetical protein C8J57DRAFT_1219976 [Mycena rebaudengoi]|nr:hypothetical protein C8J57DRAFT_1219976 [Mycena rebaudengoi]